MPTLDYGTSFDESGIDGKKAQSWDLYVLPFFQKIRTLINTTKFNYTNLQDDGVTPDKLRTIDGVVSAGYRCYNSTGAPIAANTPVHFSGYHDDGTNKYPKIVPAVVTAVQGTSLFADAITASTIADATEGRVLTEYELVDIDTSTYAVEDPVYVSTVAGAYLISYALAPAANNRCQQIGRVTMDHATTGRILFQLPGQLVPYSLLQEIT